MKQWLGTVSSSRDAPAGRTLVTGASGFIGSHLVRALVARGDDVVALVRPASDTWRLADVLNWIEVLRGDLTTIDAKSPPPELVDVHRVFHLAADGVSRTFGSSSPLVHANVVGTTNLLELSVRLDVERFVYCGSCFEYGSGEHLREEAPMRPNSPYAASKAAGSLLASAFARAGAVPVVTLRPFTAYGPFEAKHRLVPTVVLQALDDAPIELTGGEQTRDFVYVEDVLEAFMAADTADVVGRTFNVCTGEATPVRDLAATVLDLVGGGAQLKLGAIPYRDDELWALSGDPSAAEVGLGWIARTTLRDGLAKTIAWFRAERHRHPAYKAEVAPL